MDPNKKFIDFKLITFFRVMILALALFMFFAPWTKSMETSGMGTIGGVISPVLYKSVFDYMMGCEPIINSDFSIQMIYLAIIPILLIISIILSFYQKKETLFSSMVVSIFSGLPMIFWYYDISYHNPYTWGLNLAYGLPGYLIIIAITIFLGILTWLFCDLDESKLLDSASDS